MLQKFIYILLLSCIGMGFAQAQDDTKDPDKVDIGTAARIKAAKADRPDYYRSKWGIYGNVHAGVSFGFISDLETDLKKEQMFGEDYFTRSLATHYGGSINGLIGNRILVGIGGSGYNLDAMLAVFPPKDPESPAPSDEPGEVRLHAYYLFGTIGYAIYNRTRWVYDPDLEEYEFKYRWMLYPYAGFGFGGKSTMTISNYQTEDLAFGADGQDLGIIIPRSEFREFTAAYSAIELGVGSRFFKNPKGGLMMGLDLGVYLNMGSNQWETSEGSQKVEGANALSISGVYLRASVGGGYLSNHPHSSKSRSNGGGYVAPSEVEDADVIREEEPTEKPKKEKKSKKKKKDAAEDGGE